LGTTLNASTPVTTAGSDTYQYSDDQQDEVDSGVRGHNVDLDLYDDLITEEGQEKSASINEVCVFIKLLLKFLMYYVLFFKAICPRSFSTLLHFKQSAN